MNGPAALAEPILCGTPSAHRSAAGRPGNKPGRCDRLLGQSLLVVLTSEEPGNAETRIACVIIVIIVSPAAGAARQIGHALEQGAARIASGAACCTAHQTAAARAAKLRFDRTIFGRKPIRIGQQIILHRRAKSVPRRILLAGRIAIAPLKRCTQIKRVIGVMPPLDEEQIKARCALALEQFEMLLEANARD